MEQNSELLQLPADAVRHICSFVGTKEVLVTLGPTCKEMKHGFSGLSVLTTLPPHLTFNSIRKHDRTNTPILWDEIPVLFRNKNPVIAFNCKWMDQGWGNRKGHLLITEGLFEGESVCLVV